MASARLTLAVSSLKSDEISALMEMVQEEFRENPDRFDSDSHTLMSALFERWAAVDPAGFSDYYAGEIFENRAMTAPVATAARLGSWRNSDLAAARAAFDSADLSAKERRSLAKELE